MPSFFVTDIAKAHLGKELIAARIDVDAFPSGGKSELVATEKNGCRFREEVLPRRCLDRDGMPMLDVLAQHQAEFDQLDYGEVFTAAFFEAGGNQKSHEFDFRGRIDFIWHKKVKPRSPVVFYKKGYLFLGSFKKPEPCKYERIFKRIVGGTGFEYIRQWPVLRNLFATDGMQKDPLTADEVECLLEYLKSRVQETYTKWISDMSEE
eukprot:GEMP01081488.1.p1 GENE.GEMP01081488.1~~GEMP01081488.1.p1  ORF type:complete len:219 (+),score=23.74 GEMP01081488.1:37-657(+)